MSAGILLIGAVMMLLASFISDSAEFGAGAYVLLFMSLATMFRRWPEGGAK